MSVVFEQVAGVSYDTEVRGYLGHKGGRRMGIKDSVIYMLLICRHECEVEV